MKTNAPVVSAGSCSGSAGTTSYTAINSAQTIVGKTSGIGQICTIETSGVRLKVVTATSQPVGFYTGTLVLTAPY